MVCINIGQGRSTRGTEWDFSVLSILFVAIESGEGQTGNILLFLYLIHSLVFHAGVCFCTILPRLLVENSWLIIIHVSGILELLPLTKHLTQTKSKTQTFSLSPASVFHLITAVWFFSSRWRSSFSSSSLRSWSCQQKTTVKTCRAMCPC